MMNSAKAVLQAGGVRFETDSDMNYSIHIRYFQQSYVKPKVVFGYGFNHLGSERIFC